MTNLPDHPVVPGQSGASDPVHRPCRANRPVRYAPDPLEPVPADVVDLSGMDWPTLASSNLPTTISTYSPPSVITASLIPVPPPSDQFAAARAAVADPATSPGKLAKIAHQFPDLWTAVVAHPATYPGLLDWLWQYGDATVRSAITARLATTASRSLISYVPAPSLPPTTAPTPLTAPPTSLTAPPTPPTAPPTPPTAPGDTPSTAPPTPPTTPGDTPSTTPTPPGDMWPTPSQPPPVGDHQWTPPTTPAPTDDTPPLTPTPTGDTQSLKPTATSAPDSNTQWTPPSPPEDTPSTQIRPTDPSVPAVGPGTLPAVPVGTLPAVPVGALPAVPVGALPAYPVPTKDTPPTPTTPPTPPTPVPTPYLPPTPEPTPQTAPPQTAPPQPTSPQPTSPQAETPPPVPSPPSPARAILDHREPSLRATLAPADSRATVIAGVLFSVSAAISGVGLWFTSRTCVLGHTNIGDIWINFYPLSWALGAEAMSNQCQGPFSLAGISLPLGSLLLLVCAMVCWLGHRCIVATGTIVAAVLTVATATFDYFLIRSLLVNNWTAASTWSAREWQITIITTLATTVLPLVITILLIPIVRTRSATTRRRLTDVLVFVMLAAIIANPAAGGLNGTPFSILAINLVAWNTATVVLFLALLSLSQAAKAHLDESPVR